MLTDRWEYDKLTQGLPWLCKHKDLTLSRRDSNQRKNLKTSYVIRGSYQKRTCFKSQRVLQAVDGSGLNGFGYTEMRHQVDIFTGVGNKYVIKSDKILITT